MTVRVLLLLSNRLFDDRSVRTGLWSLSKSYRYSGSFVWTVLNVIVASLKWTHCCTESHWSSMRDGVIWSNFRLLSITRARVFCTRCNLEKFLADIPKKHHKIKVMRPTAATADSANWPQSLSRWSRTGCSIRAWETCDVQLAQSGNSTDKTAVSCTCLACDIGWTAGLGFAGTAASCSPSDPVIAQPDSYRHSDAFSRTFQDLQKPYSKVFQDSNILFSTTVQETFHSRHWLHKVKKCIHKIGYRCICIKVNKRKY